MRAKDVHPRPPIALTVPADTVVPAAGARRGAKPPVVTPCMDAAQGASRREHDAAGLTVDLCRAGDLCRKSSDATGREADIRSGMGRLPGCGGQQCHVQMDGIVKRVRNGRPKDGMFHERVEDLPRSVRVNPDGHAYGLESDGLRAKIPGAPHGRGVNVGREVDLQRSYRDALRNGVRVDADRETRSECRDQRLGGVRSDGFAEQAGRLCILGPLWRKVPDVARLPQASVGDGAASKGSDRLCGTGLALRTHGVEAAGLGTPALSMGWVMGCPLGVHG
jgi:hypothetical protein